MTFLCYDIKGIQRFIFSVPRLKCIVGGSALIDEFDRKSKLAGTGGSKHIFSGGGRGAFYTEDCESLKKQLLTQAHELGLDIQFGNDAQLVLAQKNADEFYPYTPDDLSGVPCDISGYLPAKKEGKANDKILARMRAGRKDELGARIIAELRNENRLPPELVDPKVEIEFFRNVSPESLDDDNPVESQLDQLHADAAASSLGRRNRWAVIAMDGNDIGSQFRAYREKSTDNEKFVDWIRVMSDAMKRCTHSAFADATTEVIAQWVKEVDLEDAGYTLANKRTVVLPLRPLILGGDDLVLLCHTKFAFTFARTMAERFEKYSVEEAEKAKLNGTPELWPASGNRLTISAGVLFTNVHLPLSSAIPYAESLLKNAKKTYTDISGSSPGSSPGKGKATAAAIDFEVVTDSLVDTPTERRRRELIFRDEELGGREIGLTRRPYRLTDTSPQSGSPRIRDSWADLDQLANTLYQLPPSVRSQLLPMLRRPWSERITFLSSLAKRYPQIKQLFWEEELVPGGWTVGQGWIKTTNGMESSVADAILLLEEENRSLQETL